MGLMGDASLEFKPPTEIETCDWNFVGTLRTFVEIYLYDWIVNESLGNAVYIVLAYEVERVAGKG